MVVIRVPPLTAREPVRRVSRPHPLAGCALAVRPHSRASRPPPLATRRAAPCVVRAVARQGRRAARPVVLHAARGNACAHLVPLAAARRRADGYASFWSREADARRPPRAMRGARTIARPRQVSRGPHRGRARRHGARRAMGRPRPERGRAVRDAQGAHVRAEAAAAAGARVVMSGTRRKRQCLSLHESAAPTTRGVGAATATVRLYRCERRVLARWRGGRGTSLGGHRRGREGGGSFDAARAVGSGRVCVATGRTAALVVVDMPCHAACRRRRKRRGEEVRGAAA